MFVICVLPSKENLLEEKAFVNIDNNSGGYYFYSESPYFFRTKERAVEYAEKFPKNGCSRLGDVWQVCEVSYNLIQEV